jgi:uncharacterized protein
MGYRSPRLTVTGSRTWCEKIVREVENHVRPLLTGEATGHDWFHADRVRQLALKLAEAEGADKFTVELAALLHDVDDYKFSGSVTAGPDYARRYLDSLGVSKGISESVEAIIAAISFRGALVNDTELSIEADCVQDADRLEAIGAIGIARTFAYGGFVGRPIYDPSVAATLHTCVTDYQQIKGTTINHFYEKLLLLKDRMKTTTGRRLAEQRHQVVIRFLTEFFTEWDVRDAGLLQ